MDPVLAAHLDEIFKLKALLKFRKLQISGHSAPFCTRPTSLHIQRAKNLHSRYMFTVILTAISGPAASGHGEHISHQAAIEVKVQMQQ